MIFLGRSKMDWLISVVALLQRLRRWRRSDKKIGCLILHSLFLMSHLSHCTPDCICLNTYASTGFHFRCLLHTSLSGALSGFLQRNSPLFPEKTNNIFTAIQETIRLKLEIPKTSKSHSNIDGTLKSDFLWKNIFLLPLSTVIINTHFLKKSDNCLNLHL